ncbi:hypothetical protein LJB89_01095 [Tyzzerella sp. OttesenSCG-928-J15]|nr:hypothetical protein [Tyzzerella sp. OttesenSCG-928-J15]
MDEDKLFDNEYGEDQPLDKSNIGDEEFSSILSDDEREALLSGFGASADDGETMSEEDLEIDSINLDDLDFDFSDDGSLKFDMAEELVDDLDLEFIQDVTVYDTVERDDKFGEVIAQATENMSGNIGEEGIKIDGFTATEEVADEDAAEETKEETEKKKGKLKLNFKFKSPIPINTAAVAVILLVVVATVGMAGFFIINTLRGIVPVENELIMNAEPIKQPRYVANNSSSIYLTSNPAFYMMDIIDIVKLTANEEFTEFTFKYDVGWGKYKISLIDNRNNEYRMMPSSMDVGHYSNTLRFEPLKNGIKGVVFSIAEIETGETNQFPYRFESGLKVMPVNYLNAQRIMLDDETISIKLMNASFSNSESNVTFTMEWKEDVSIGFDNMSLKSGAKNIIAKENSISSYRLSDNIDVYNVKFGTLNSMNGMVDLNFTDVYYEYDTAMKIDPAPLFANTPETEKKIVLGDHTVTLERMGAMGPIYVLVANCEDGTNERVHTEYNTVLTLSDADGKQYTIEGDCLSGDIGADILFDTRNIEDYENIGPLNVIGLDIDKVKINRENITAYMNLDKTSSYRDINDKRAIEAAKEYLYEQGAQSAELVFYFWSGDNFVGEFDIFEDGEVKKYAVTGTADRNVYTFESTQL